VQLTRRNFILAAAAVQLAACSGQHDEQADRAAPAPAPAAAAPARTVAVELFTSQGCSSCPPADAVLDKIGQEPGIVVMSRPVTYWDRLGWRDTFGRAQNDALQLSYVRRLGAQTYYTPQAVVQGAAELIGSHERTLRERIAEARGRGGPDLQVADGSVRLSGNAARPAEVRVVALKSHADVPIGRGENGGRTVRYTNVVLDEAAIGAWRGGAAELPIPAAATRVRGADRYAIIVQESGAGPILAASYLPAPAG